MERKSTTLGFEKVKDLIERKGFVLNAVFVEDGECRFLECNTPDKRRTFLIFISSRRYTLPYRKGIPIRYTIYRTDEKPSKKRMSFIEEMKGDVEANLTMVSSEDMVYCHYGDEITRLFSFFPTRSALKPEEKVLSELPSTERNALTFLAKVGKKPEFPTKPSSSSSSDSPEEISSKHSNNDSNNNESNNEENTEKPEKEEVELEFQDQDGRKYEAEELQLFTPEEKNKEPLKLVSAPNFLLTDNIQNEDLHLGFIYVTLNLEDFFKSKEKLRVDKIYSSLEKNERDSREKRLERVRNLFNDVISILDLLSKKEENYKERLDQLSNTLHQITKVKQEYRGNPSLKIEAEEIENQTRSTITEVNIDLQKTRERISEFMNDLIYTMKDMKNLYSKD